MVGTRYDRRVHLPTASDSPRPDSRFLTSDPPVSQHVMWFYFLSVKQLGDRWARTLVYCESLGGSKCTATMAAYLSARRPTSHGYHDTNYSSRNSQPKVPYVQASTLLIGWEMTDYLCDISPAQHCTVCDGYFRCLPVGSKSFGHVFDVGIYQLLTRQLDRE